MSEFKIKPIDSGEEVKEFYNKYFTEKISVSSNKIDAVVGFFEKRGFVINWKALEKQSLDETINALAMASPFSLEEKQILLESETLDIRKNNISDILKTYTHDVINNNTLQ